MTTRRVLRVAAPRKSFGVHAVHADPYHVAAAFAYRNLCSAKKLARAWRVDLATANRYRNGAIVSALARLLWEIVLLERAGIPTTLLWALIRRTALRARRCQPFARAA